MAGYSFVESEVPDITETIPFPISARTTNPVFVDKTFKADISINEMDFRLAISDQNLYQRETADFRRQQIDTSKEPGEQSLSQWWVRDQNSWHRGAGINFYEPGSVDTTEFRFHTSLGVDVWTQGQATLLKAAPQLIPASTGQNAFVTSSVVSGINVFFGVLNGTLFRHDGTTRTNYTGTTAVAAEPVVTGAKVLAGATTGLWAGDATGTTLTNLWTTATAVVVKPYWVKSRIIATQGPKLWDLTLAGGSLDSTTPLFTHPSTSWTWSSVAEAPGAILAAGYDNGYGYIYKFSLVDGAAGTTPTLGSPIQLADFPPGEQVYCIKSYLSQYLAIGTSRGLRIGNVTTTLSGVVQLQYGPLTVETSQPVRCLTARDRFVYCGIEADLEGQSGMARVDLSVEIGDNTQRFAWAYDAQAHVSGVVQSVSFLGVSDRVVCSILGQGIFLGSTSLYETSGYILSGKIRYGTSEPKTFNLLKVRASIPDAAGIAVNTISETNVDEYLTTLGSGWDTSQDITLRTLADFGQSHASVRLTLTSNTDHTTAPTLTSMQMKATPQPRIQRNIRLPLRLDDVEQDRNGVKLGKTGSAAVRLLALEAMEENSTLVLVTDYTSGEAFTGHILQVQFVRDTPPSRNRKNFGGVVNLVVLKL